MFNQEVVQLFLYLFIAVVRTIIDIIIWKVLVVFFKEGSFFERFARRIKLNRYSLAQAVAFIISVAISYSSNKSLVFRDDSGSTLTSVFSFTLVSTFSLVLSVWLINYMTTNQKLLDWAKKYPLTYNHWPMIAKLSTIFVTLFSNYFGYKFLVFG